MLLFLPPHATSRPLGRTLAKRRCLEARGWRVLSVPGHEWRQLPSQEAQVGQLACTSRGLSRGYNLNVSGVGAAKPHVG